MMRLRLAPRTVLLCLLLTGACRRGADAQAAAMEPCPWWGCAGNNVCLAETNTCVKPCARDDDCPVDFLCKGYFSDITTYSGRGGRFCRKADLPPGSRCTAFGPACAGNMSCVDGICRPPCTLDEDCPDGWKCHITVLGSEEISPAFAYRVCARASLPEHAACTSTGEPTCARGMVCMFEHCQRTCTQDSDCPDGQTCSGRGFDGWQGRLRMMQSRKPDFLFCMP